jgi:hypothetical protein
MKIQFEIDRNGFATVLRTMAALLIGNSLVVPVLTEGRSRYWWVLLVVGVIGMIVTNVKLERRPK